LRHLLNRLEQSVQLLSPATKVGCPIQALFLGLEWDTRHSTKLPFGDQYSIQFHSVH
jgi:hypothetical protein